ncbi:MAG: flavin reductase family protein [Ruminococcaceae bacterium]|nr:flavin reductase family protein [Oscillospiraceae bacterium]
MAKQSWKGSTLLAPLPFVMVSCGEGEESNIITIAWTGIVNSKPPMTYISVRPERHSYDIIKKSGEFVINLVDSRLTKAADYCGIYTGKKVDKFAKMKLTREEAFHVACPSIAESPLSIECRVNREIELGSHTMFLADILSVNVKEELLDEKGRLCLDKANLAVFTHGEYFATGKKLGKFGFAAKKK